MLAQIGEFSFVLGEIGYKSGVISTYGHQLVTLIIAVTLLVSPAWIIAVKYLSNKYIPLEVTEEIDIPPPRKQAKETATAES